MTMTITVVINTYNQAHYINEAIDSVLNQTRLPDEIIVIDDGSSDDISSVLNRYPQVRYVRQNNQGLAAARNRGLSESRSEYIAFLDADDRLLPRALESNFELLQTNPQACLAFGFFRLISLNGEPMPLTPRALDVNDFYVELLRDNVISMHATVMYRTAILRSINGFNPSLKASEDYELYFRLADVYPVVRHLEVIAEYRRHDTNMSSDQSLMLDATLAVMRMQLGRIGVNRKRREAYRDGIANWRERYGEGVVEHIRQLIRTNRNPRLIARNVAILLRFNPQLIVRHMGRKVKCLLLRPGNPESRTLTAVNSLLGVIALL